MGLSFLAPLFFAGMALLAAPFLIHRIRRPEREPIRFSSVLFIPDVTKEVIERRRIEHILLMLLRMAVLALLALAFTRPYWRAMAAVDADEAPKRHMVLVDASYSMDRGGAFDEAKRAARRIVDEVASGEPVGVIVFADRPRLAAPLHAPDDTRAGSKDAARDAINLASLTFGATDYVAALELAQQQLLGGADENVVHRSIVHLVTDTQRVGLPEDSAGWKLAPAVELDVVAVGKQPPRDFAVTETYVRPSADGTLRVLGKVRNWSTADAKELNVKLFIDDKEIASKTLDVNGRSASQVSFELPEPHAPEFDGYLEVTEGGARADDRRYFSYRPPRQSRIAIVSAQAEPEDRSGAWFFVQALPSSTKSPWRARSLTPADLASLLDDPVERPDAVVLTETASLSEEAAQSLIRYVEGGGQLLLALGETTPPAALAARVQAAGITFGDLQYENPRTSQFETLSWLDFEHPVFALFQGTRYNDFSLVRLYNHRKLDVADPARVIARLDDDAPAIVEAPIGEGRVMVWPFAVRLEWTNLPKTPRFVPLLFETLAYASGWEERAGDYAIGETLPGPALEYNTEGEAEIRLPGQTESRTITVATAGEVRFDRPGLLRARLPGAPEWSLERAVNVNAREGDPERLEPETLLAKVATSSVLAENTAGAGIVGTDVDTKGYAIDEEYGRWALIAVCALVLMECWYMSRLSARRSAGVVPAAGSS